MRDNRSICDQKLKKKYTCIHRNYETGLAIIYKHAAHRLVQHTLQAMETAWTDDSTLAISISAVVRRGWSPDTMSQATKTNGITECWRV